jgi:hypothetical protein
VYIEARALLRAAVTDIFFNCWCLEIPSYNRIWHLPGCLYNHKQNLRLETFYDFYALSGSRNAQLFSVGPDWFGYYFVYENFVCLWKDLTSVQVVNVFWSALFPLTSVWGIYIYIYIYIYMLQVSLLSRRNPRYLTSSC